MKEKEGFEINLNSTVPFIKKYDLENNTGYGKFFDEFERIGCHCTLHTPSENKVRHGDKEPFFVTSIQGNLTESIGHYKGVGTHGESIIGTVQKFIKDIFEKCDQGHLVSVGTDSESLYKLVVTSNNVVLEKYIKGKV